jgi:hypothetical protein
MAIRTIFISLFISTLLFSQAALSQSADDRVTLTVKDSSGAPISGAKVDVTLSGVTIRSLVTDANGSVQIEKFKEGRLKATVSASGFATVVRDLDYSGELIDVILSVGGLNEVVTVTATRTQVTASAISSGPCREPRLSMREPFRFVHAFAGSTVIVY